MNEHEHPAIATHRERLASARSQPHPHKARNVNVVHAAEHVGFNARVAVWTLRIVGTMWCTYVFAVFGLPAVVTAVQQASVLPIINAVSSNWLQLWLLPAIMVGQAIAGRKSEIQADEAFLTTQKTYADIESVMTHLAAQDDTMLAILHEIKAAQGAVSSAGLTPSGMLEAPVPPTGTASSTSVTYPLSTEAQREIVGDEEIIQKIGMPPATILPEVGPDDFVWLGNQPNRPPKPPENPPNPFVAPRPPKPERRGRRKG